MTSSLLHGGPRCLRGAAEGLQVTPSPSPPPGISHGQAVVTSISGVYTSMCRHALLADHLLYQAPNPPYFGLGNRCPGVRASARVSSVRNRQRDIDARGAGE